MIRLWVLGEQTSGFWREQNKKRWSQIFGLSRKKAMNMEQRMKMNLDFQILARVKNDNGREEQRERAILWGR